MFHIRLADLCIRIENQYPFVENQCRNFLCDAREAAITVSVTDAEIAAGASLKLTSLYDLAVAAGVEDPQGFVQHFIDYEREECRHEG